MVIKDLTCQRFGRITALYRLHNYHKKGTYWLCVCDCGNLKEVSYSCLAYGHSKSCGCYNSEVARIRMIKHGKKNTRLYHIWKLIKQRCNNKNNPAYKNYGGRGIAVCDEWRNDFQAFYDWSMANGYDDNLTIDRIDNNKGYSPDNCRWATVKQQAQNRRTTKKYTINNETHCLKDWCELLGLNYRTVHKRIYNHNWSIEKALELEGQ